MKKNTKTVAATINTNRRTATADQRAAADKASAAAYAKRNGLDKPAPAAKREALAAAAGFVKPAKQPVTVTVERPTAGHAIVKVRPAKGAKPAAVVQPDALRVANFTVAGPAVVGPVARRAERKAAKTAAAAEKPVKAAKPAGPVAVVKVACAKCGRENNRPEGQSGDCRVASACKARVRRATEPAKAVKTAKPTAKPAAAAASAPAAAPAAAPRLVKTAKRA